MVVQQPIPALEVTPKQQELGIFGYVLNLRYRQIGGTMYTGTVSLREKARRRERNRVARQSRKANRRG